ncbi:MAG: TonB-dependent receptor, partial [Burkholderiales bacterium]|nr:TonB-dependent receptor [Burkholderiales bacterium]
MAIRSGEELEVIDLLGTAGNRWVTCGRDFDFVDKQLWTLHGDTLQRRALEDLAPVEAALALPAPADRLVVGHGPQAVEAVLVGETTPFLLSARASGVTAEALDELAEGERPVAVLGWRVLVAGADRLRAIDRGGREAWRTLAPLGGEVLGAWFLFGGRAVAVFLRSDAGDAFRVIGPTGAAIHHIAIARASCWCVAEQLGQAFVYDGSQDVTRVDLRYARGSATLTWLQADNTLTGNGMVPYELWRQDPAGVFTSPDRANNVLQHFNAIARVDVSERSALSVQAYRRDMRQDSVGGDFWDEFRAASSRLRLDCNDGLRNSVADGATGVDLPGCPNLQPNGLLNTGRTGQVADGVQLQWTWASPRHQFVAGAAFDRNAVSFQQGQRLGFLSGTREFTFAPDRIADVGLVPLAQEIQRNDLSGGMESQSVFAKDIWSVRDDLHLNIGLRWNRTRVKQALVSDRPIPLYQFDETFFRRLEPRCGAEIGGAANRFARYFCTTGDYVYQSLNPSVGLTWAPADTLNLYANWSRGTRVPSAIELGCARDREGEARVRGRTPGCSVPTALTYDPFLPQVVSYTSELGARGVLTTGLRWNASIYRTDLSNDILFVSLGSRNRGVFDTFGNSRRQGFELGIEQELGRHSLRASLSHVEATFESTATVVNASNSTATTAVGRVSEFQIRPGDRIPGIPQNALRLAWRWRTTDAVSVGLSMVAHSWSYVRGNENN